MDFTKLIEWLKLSPKYLFPLSLVTGFAIFSPINILDVFGLAQFISQFKPVVGVIFLLSSVLLLTNSASPSFEWIKNQIKQQQDAKSMYEKLHSLTSHEKMILRGYIANQTRTQYFSIEDGVVRGLEIDKIIFRATIAGRANEWAYNIQPWAWEYLNSHPKLVAQEKSDGHNKQRL